MTGQASAEMGKAAFENHAPSVVVLASVQSPRTVRRSRAHLIDDDQHDEPRRGRVCAEAGTRTPGRAAAAIKQRQRIDANRGGIGGATIAFGASRSAPTVHLVRKIDALRDQHDLHARPVRIRSIDLRHHRGLTAVQADSYPLGRRRRAGRTAEPDGGRTARRPRLQYFEDAVSRLRGLVSCAAIAWRRTRRDAAAWCPGSAPSWTKGITGAVEPDDARRRSPPPAWGCRAWREGSRAIDDVPAHDHEFLVGQPSACSTPPGCLDLADVVHQRRQPELAQQRPSIPSARAWPIVRIETFTIWVNV